MFTRRSSVEPIESGYLGALPPELGHADGCPRSSPEPGNDAWELWGVF